MLSSFIVCGVGLEWSEWCSVEHTRSRIEWSGLFIGIVIIMQFVTYLHSGNISTRRSRQCSDFLACCCSVPLRCFSFELQSCLPPSSTPFMPCTKHPANVCSRKHFVFSRFQTFCKVILTTMNILITSSFYSWISYSFIHLLPLSVEMIAVLGLTCSVCFPQLRLTRINDAIVK